jgi:hypothetical protein
MEFLPFFLTLFISYLGLPAGLALAFISPEEMPTGRKFFPLLQSLLLVSIAAIVISVFVAGIYARLPLYALAILLASIRLNPAIIYTAFALIFFLVSKSQPEFLAVAVLIFLYGLPAGSSHPSKGIADAMKYSLKGLPFLLVASGLYIILSA